MATSASGPTVSPLSPHWRAAIISCVLVLMAGGLVGAFVGKAFMFFFFSFWFITFSAVIGTMGILFWLMLIKSIRFFCFISLVDICLFFGGVVLGMLVTGQ